MLAFLNLFFFQLAEYYLLFLLSSCSSFYCEKRERERVKRVEILAVGKARSEKGEDLRSVAGVPACLPLQLPLQQENT